MDYDLYRKLITLGLVPIEYLESTSTQWIDTGIIPDANTGVQVTAMKLTTTDLHILGLRNDSGNTRWTIGQIQSKLYYGYGEYYFNDWNNAPINTQVTASLNYLNDKKFIVEDKSAVIPTLSFIPTYSILLFGYNNKGTVRYCACRIYNVKISQGSEIVMDLIPVRVGTIGYMYDTVSGQLFGNAGTGNFILGNDIYVPNPLDIDFKIYNGDNEPFHNLELKKATYDSVVMSFGDKISGDVYYKDNSLSCTMHEYIVYEGVQYNLVNPPTIVREGMISDNSDLKGMTKYSFEFYHPMHMLSDFPFTDVAVSNDELLYKSQDKVFTWVGYLQDFINKLNKNLQGTQWICDLSELTQESTLKKFSDVLTFDNNTIADALKTAYETWDVPFVIDIIPVTDELYEQGKRFLIHFGEPSNEIYESEEAKEAGTPFVFKFGQGVGLKNNSATPKNNKIITRIAGYGSERNVPFGYPQIVWDEDDDESDLQYPLYDGIVGGRWVKLIKHPFTRNHLMPTIYAETVARKVNPRADYYDPDTEIIDYHDALDQSVYQHTINPNAPSYEVHEFEDIFPEFGVKNIVGVQPINDDMTDATDWDDSINDQGDYNQGYFKFTLPILDFDLYACAAITEEMQINMRTGACIGCTFTIQVDWEDYKLNFYDQEGNFVPDGSQRDLTKYPKSQNTQITVICQKDTNTFGTLMPNIFQKPKGTIAGEYDGDEFVILGISLPESHIIDAQHRLDEAMDEYMLENNVYYFEYPLKFDEYFLATHTYVLNQIKNNTIVRFEFKGEIIPLYVKQITIKYGDSPLPQYNITLTDDVDIVLNQIGQVTDDVSKMRLQVSALQSYFDKNLINDIQNKLSKTQDDTARGKITFNRGFDVGNFIPDSSGASMSIGNNGETSLELDFITVRRAAKFREITIQELKHIGGELALTAAAMECSKVELVENGYKCYFETTYGDKTIYQEFVVGDQARCQQFKLEDTGDGYQSTKYYWRIVKEVGENYIVLSNTSGEYDGNGVPASGDKIVQLGYRKELNNNNDIPYRTTAIILSATSNDAPSTKYYEGITSFSLSNVVKDEGYSDGVFHSNIYGSSYVGAKDRSSYAEYTPNGGMKVNAQLTIGSKLDDGTDVNNLMTADINLLLNSGFTGDFKSQDVTNTDNVSDSTEIYSPSFKHWNYNSGCLIRQSTDSASGFECYMGSIGELSQTIENTKETSYVVSIKAYGEDLTISFGDVEKTYTLTSDAKYYSFKVVNPTNGLFKLETSGGCVICEPMVAEGNVFDAWSRSPLDNDKAIEEVYAFSYLMSALSQASTTINKGLLLTQLIKVGNYRDGSMIEETGGMNGLVTDDDGGATDPFIWGGGTMNQALYTIMKYKDDPSYQASDEEVASMAKFVVTHGGRAILNDIVLRGYIYALGGYFKGEINAQSGKIANITINEDGLGTSQDDVYAGNYSTFLTNGKFEYTRKSQDDYVQESVTIGSAYYALGYQSPIYCSVQTTDVAIPVAATFSAKGTMGGFDLTHAYALYIPYGLICGFRLPVLVVTQSSDDVIGIDEDQVIIVSATGKTISLGVHGQFGTMVFIKGNVDSYNVSYNATTIGISDTNLHIFVATESGVWIRLQ